MTQIDPPEFEPDVDDLLRCSRFLDGDLDPQDRSGFEADLARRHDLRQLLAELRAVTAQVRTPIGSSDAELDQVMVAVWARLDESAAFEHPATPPTLATDRSVTVIGHPVRPSRPSTRRQRAWAPVLQWSAAAAVVVAIALVALSGGGGDDVGSGDAESASVEFDQQRGEAAASDETVNNHVQDALGATTAPTTGNTNIDLGSFSTVTALLDTVQAHAATGSARTEALEATGATNAAPSADASPAAAANFCAIDPPAPTSRAVSSGFATVAEAPVLWTVWVSDGRQQIIIQDARNCAVLADRHL